jgi:hypothetical protein
VLFTDPYPQTPEMILNSLLHGISEEEREPQELSHKNQEWEKCCQGSPWNSSIQDFPYCEDSWKKFIEQPSILRGLSPPFWNLTVRPWGGGLPEKSSESP